MARFKPSPNLEERLAFVIAPKVGRIAEMVGDEARGNAPPTKVWVSRRDGRVRDTHVEADNDNPIPDNLRFTVTSMQWDRENRGVGPFTYMRFPRDESSRAYVNLIHCRCKAVKDPNGISRNIKTLRPVVQGKRVVAKVVSTGLLVVEAEFGTVYPGGLEATGVRYMGRAADTVRARLNARQRP